MHVYSKFDSKDSLIEAICKESTTDDEFAWTSEKLMDSFTTYEKMGEWIAFVNKDRDQVGNMNLSFLPDENMSPAPESGFHTFHEFDMLCAYLFGEEKEVAPAYQVMEPEPEEKERIPATQEVVPETPEPEQKRVKESEE